MRIALVAPPFISVPPPAYGGTELFIAHLADELIERGHDVILYANGESRTDAELRYVYAGSRWPLATVDEGLFRNLHHTAWAIRDAADAGVDVVHLNDAVGVALARFVDAPAVHTLHHPHDPALSAFYAAHPEVAYVAISHAQQARECLPRLRTIHHGIRLADYPCATGRRTYLSFLGRLAPMKGAHAAIEVARRAGIPLKIAGEVQPVFRDYWEQMIRPHVDGVFIDYVGEATHGMKTELLGGAIALLFPVDWEEPFGLVMVEAMACGTPVLALPRGAVPEVVRDGVSGWICRDVDDMAARARDLRIDAGSCRDHVARGFSVERMTQDYERLYRECVGGRGCVPDQELAPLLG